MMNEILTSIKLIKMVALCCPTCFAGNVSRKLKTSFCLLFCSQFCFRSMVQYAWGEALVRTVMKIREEERSVQFLVSTHNKQINVFIIAGASCDPLRSFSPLQSRCRR